ncbi:MAG: hypothetical protein WAU11_15710 [Ignavibacteriaceae bacterium]
MSDKHSNSECENILSAKEIEKNLFNSKEHSEQLDRIIKSKGKLVVYLSIIYGAIIFLGLVYLFVI